MILKKILGDSVDEAREEARRLYGEHVVVLETFTGDGKNEPAGVTVLVDKPTAERTVTDATPPGNFRNVFYKRSDAMRMRRPVSGSGVNGSEGGRSMNFSDVNEPEGGEQTDAATKGASEHSAGPLSGPEPGPSRRMTRTRFGTPQQDPIQQPEKQVYTDESAKPVPSDPPSFSRRREPAPESDRFMPEQPIPTRFDPAAKRTSRLDSLRRYATENDALRGKELSNFKPVSERFNPAGPYASYGTGQANEPATSSVSPSARGTATTATNAGRTAATDNHNAATGTTAALGTGNPAGKTGATPAGGKATATHSDDLPLAEPKGWDQSPLRSLSTGYEEQSRREIAALHKRFDRLESLLDENLAAADIDLVAHPAFQQLVRSGVRPALVSRWFTGIIKKGTDPLNQPEKFMQELSGLVRKALDRQPADPASPIQVFMGASGAGKTHLVKHLAVYAQKHGKNALVVSVKPEDDPGWYTILEPFCADRGITHYVSAHNKGILDLEGRVEDFDMVLVDTPALPMNKEKAYRQAWSMRQLWSIPAVQGQPEGPVTEDIPPLDAELNYVVNAANGPSAMSYLSSLHHTLQPGAVSFTHMDEVQQWGPLIPFMEEMNAPCRYIGAGLSEETGIQPYDVTEAARNIVQDS